MAFRKIHEDKAVSMDTRCLFEWCPTMDLLAFVTNENHIVLHRLSWAKLGSFFEHSSLVTALATGAARVFSFDVHWHSRQFVSLYAAMRRYAGRWLAAVRGGESHRRSVV